MRSPRVSIVVPTFQRAALLERTLDSIAALEFEDHECIVVDDGSTDDTMERLEARRAADPRIRFVRQPNSSASHARNRGLALARAEYTAFVDSDDLVPGDRLGWQVEALDRDPLAVLAYGETFQFVDGDPTKGSLYLADVAEKPAGWAFEPLLRCSSIYSPLVRTRVARSLGGFDTSLASAEDWDLWLSLSRVGKFVFEPRVSLLYRVHAGNKSGRIVTNYSCARRVARKHLAHVPFGRRAFVRFSVRSYFQRVYTEPLLRFGWERSKKGDWSSACLAWRAVATLNPRVLMRSRALAAHALWSFFPGERRRPFWWRDEERSLVEGNGPSLSPVGTSEARSGRVPSRTRDGATARE